MSGNEVRGNCPACWCLWSLHGPDGCNGKVFPAHSLDGKPCPCEHTGSEAEAAMQADGQAASLTEAARWFAETWRELLTGMPDTYGCTMTCTEAEAAAGLYRALGDEDTAAEIVATHARYDEEDDDHYQGAAATAEEGSGQ